MTLEELGWDAAFGDAFAALDAGDTLVPARVAVEFNYLYRVWTTDGEREATVSGRLKHRAGRRSELPVVGDWVAVRIPQGQDSCAIVAVLPRRGAFSRRGAGQTVDEQVVASNVDVAFVVMALDADFSVRRLERYLLLSRESGASAVVLLTKPDLSESPQSRFEEVASVAGSVPVHVINPRMNEGLEQVGTYLARGRTGALLGSSGVGKSTIINRLVGQDVRRTGDVRASDSKGRHTTSHRELVSLPGGGLIIDTPGMRELQLWDVGDAMRETFDDIEALAADCHFTDCRHETEPRCAVRAAAASGVLDAKRLESYIKLQAELRQLGREQQAQSYPERQRRPKGGGRRPGQKGPV